MNYISVNDYNSKSYILVKENKIPPIGHILETGYINEIDIV